MFDTASSGSFPHFLAVYFDNVLILFERLGTGCTLRGSNPGGGEIIRTRPDLPWDPPRVPGLSWGVALTTHPHLAPRLKKE